MAWLDFLKNGNELSELLIEGHNPYGAQLLKQADVDQMRDHIQPGERVLGYVLGRVVLAGRGLWLLTDQNLLISENDSGNLVHHFALKDITQAECVKGKYGYTLRVTAAGQQRSVYGASSLWRRCFTAPWAKKRLAARSTNPPPWMLTMWPRWFTTSRTLHCACNLWLGSTPMPAP